VSLGTVTTTGPQRYADPQGTTLVTGNLTAAGSPITFNDSVVVSDGVSVDAGPSFIYFAGTGVQTLQSGIGSHFANVLHSGPGTLQLTSGLTVTGTLVEAAGTFDAHDQPVTVGGQASISGGTFLAGEAPLSFTGGLVLASGTFTSSGAPMTVSGPIAVLGGVLSGQGTVGPVTAVGGTIAPGGNGPGVLSIAGPATFFSSTTLRVVCNGLTPGSGYAQLQASGPITLGGAMLNLVFGFVPPVGSSFEILTNAGSAPVNGTFPGLNEGSVFNVGNYQFQITYQGGSNGHSVVITRLS
jgi:fibronectin-binding autotransporter adhesin